MESLMFEGAKTELGKTRVACDGLRSAHDQREFLTRFNDVVGGAQSVLIAMLREGRGERLPGFALWYKATREALDDDEVMVVVREARDYDFNDGPHKLRFVKDQGPLRVDEQGRPVKDGAWWTMPAAPSTHVAMDGAPTTHEGQSLDRTDPVALCGTVIECLERLLAEAESAVG
jgi:hypothetical protein